METQEYCFLELNPRLQVGWVQQDVVGGFTASPACSWARSAQLLRGRPG